MRRNDGHKHSKSSYCGSTGYGGVELIRLRKHPRVEITSVISSSTAGYRSDGFPHLTNIMTQNLDGVNPAEIAEVADLCSRPRLRGQCQAGAGALDAGLKVIDLSGDFRLKDGVMNSGISIRLRVRNY